MQSILLVTHVLIACALVGLVLLQHGKGADAGAAFGSGASGSIFGSRGPTSFLTRVTAVLAALFFTLSLTLAYISGQSVERKSVVERAQSTEPGILFDEEGGSNSQTDVPDSPDASFAPEGDIPDVPAQSGEHSSDQDNN